MAKITSKSSLNVGTELTIDTTNRTITLNVAGNLVAKDGVTFQALYSKFIDLWTTSTYNDFPFPFYVIDALSGQFSIGFDGSRYNTWKWAGTNTRTYLRDGGWSEYSATSPGADGTSATGALARQYVGIVSLGSVSSGSQLYYQTTSTGTATNFTYTDAVSEGIQVFGDNAVDATTTTFDTRTFFKGFVREYGKKYKDSVLADTGKTGTGAYIVNLLLSNENDLDIVADDTTVDSAVSPWNKMSVKYFSQNFTKDVDTSGTGRNFGIVIDVGTHSGVDGSHTSAGNTLTSAAGGIVGADFVGGTLVIHEGTAKGTYNISGTPTSTVVTISGNFPAGAGTNISFTLKPAVAVSATLQQIYTWTQRQLRKASDIDATTGSVIGKTATQLLNFVGSRLDCGFYSPTNPNGGGSGVIVEGVAAADINSIRFYDTSATYREYPYQSAGTISFSSNLVGAGSYYRLYFKQIGGADSTNDYGSATAVTVNDASGNPIAGTIGASSISFTYDYTGNVQGGHVGNTDTDVVLVTGRPGYAKPTVSFGTLTASKSISLSSVGETDRAYV